MGDPRGPLALREALTEYLGRVRGVRATPESIVICSGVREGVELMGRVLGPERAIAVEAHGLFIFRDALAAAGVPTTPIGLDDHGAVISDLDGRDAPAVLLTPAHQSPFGMALHPAGAPRSSTGRSAPADTCWTTTTTASSATTANPSAPCSR